MIKANAKQQQLIPGGRKMNKEEILVMSNRLRLPEAVLAPLAAAANTLPDELPTGQLAEPETAAAAWQAITAQIPDWREDNGMAQLAVMLAAVCHTEERYRQRGIPEEVFLPTMDCFRRFLEETKARIGQWSFDRGFWTWRQTGGLLFRLGTLEFEYRKAGTGPRPEGLAAESPVLSVHIPSDAILKREELDRSYGMAHRFFSREMLFSFGVPKAIVCGSWLLAPALDGLLPENSGIRCFAGDYRIYSVDEEDQEFYEWLFGGYKPLGELPEHTSLQRAVKARLTAGGRLGMARGVLNGAFITQELSENNLLFSDSDPGTRQ